MALDKAVDSDVLDAGLLAVAEAIRTKGGTADALVFPDGFVNAVEAISGEADSSIVDAIVEDTVEEIRTNAAKIGKSALFKRSNLRTLYAPNVATLEESCLDTCAKLVDVFLPLVSSVGPRAFQGCSVLSAIDLPLATSIGAYAFYGGRVLTAVILRSETMCTLSATTAFGNCYHILGTVNVQSNPNGLKDGYIYVPKTLVESYQGATNWSTYASQIRALEDYTVDGTITGALDPDKI